MKRVAHTKPLTQAEKTARDSRLIQARKRLTDYYFACKDKGFDTRGVLRRLIGGSQQAGSRYFRSRISRHNTNLYF